MMKRYGLSIESLLGTSLIVQVQLPARELTVKAQIFLNNSMPFLTLYFLVTNTMKGPESELLSMIHLEKYAPQSTFS